MLADIDSPDVKSVFYCNSIVYDNHILNEPQVGELFKLAKADFGMKGVKKLIDIGLEPVKYQEFQVLRKGMGREKSSKILSRATIGRYWT